MKHTNYKLQDVDDVQTLLWQTHEGEWIALKDMDTQHLYNSFLMIWNNSTPEKWQIGTFKQWNLSHLSKVEKRVYMKAMLLVLASRKKELTILQEGSIKSILLAGKYEMMQKIERRSGL